MSAIVASVEPFDHTTFSLRHWQTLEHPTTPKRFTAVPHRAPRFGLDRFELAQRHALQGQPGMQLGQSGTALRTARCPFWAVGEEGAEGAIARRNIEGHDRLELESEGTRSCNLFVWLVG